jgi:hypothetical protein
MDDFDKFDSSDSETEVAIASTSVQGSAEKKRGFPAAARGKKPATGPAVVFQGSVSCKNVSLVVLPYEKTSSARLVISVPWKANTLTCQTVQGAAGGPNYGDADLAAGAYATFRNIHDAMSDQVMAAKYGVVSGHMYATGTVLNMVFDFVNKETKVFNSLKTIFSKMEPKRAVYSAAIAGLSGPDGKALKPTTAGWDAACSAAEKARKSISVFATGRLLVKSRDGLAGVKAKVSDKLAKACVGLERHKPVGAAAAPDHAKYNMPSHGKLFEIRDSADYFAYDFYREIARPFGHGFVLVREPNVSADAKSRHAEKIMMKAGRDLNVMAAWYASAVGIFTADDLAGFARGEIKKGDIVRAI